MIKMKIKKSKLILFGLVLSVLTSCVSNKKMVYFQDMADESSIPEEVINVETKLKIGDVITINVSAIDAEAAVPFNLFEAGSATNLKPMQYLVNADGEINFPVIGKVKIEGLSTKEITNNLTNVLSDYIVKPIVNVRLTNFKVTVLGEVKNPGTFSVPNERMTIVEALGVAGDLTMQGKRKNVILVREEEGKRKFIPIDLTSKKLFASPYYYLAQNDVIYVESNKAKINSSVIGANTSIIFSSISTLISIIAILTR